MTDPSNLTFDAIPMSLSMPEGLTWHMILDHELSQLTRPETGVLGSIGWVGLGAVLGLVVPFVGVLEKIGDATITKSDVSCLLAFAFSVAATLVCLGVAGIAWWRNSGLAQHIRSRTTRDIAFTDSANAARRLPAGV
jgi:hypothetical protein